MQIYSAIPDKNGEVPSNGSYLIIRAFHTQHVYPAQPT